MVFRDSSGWLPNVQPAIGLGSRVHDGLEFIGLVPSSAESDLIKCVIGVGGDAVEERDGKVHVNGNVLDEPYVFPGNSPSESNFTAIVPAGNLDDGRPARCITGQPLPSAGSWSGFCTRQRYRRSGVRHRLAGG